MHLRSSRTAYLIIAAFICIMLLSAPVFAQSDSIDQIVVTVDGEPVTETDIQRRMRVLAFEAGLERTSQSYYDQFRRQAIEEAISFAVQRQFAQRNNIFVQPQQVVERIEMIAQQSQASVDQFFQQFAAADLNPSDVSTVISEQLLLEQLVQRVLVGRVTIRPEEIDRYLESNRRQFSRTVRQYNLVAIAVTTPLTANIELLKDLRQLILEINSELKNGRDFIEVAQAVSGFDGVDVGSLGWISEEDIDPKLAAEVTDASVGQYVGPVQLGSNTLFARVEGQRDAPGFSVGPLKEFHLARIVLHASTEIGAETVVNELEAIRENLLQGGDFSALAKLYSHDIDTKPDGGDLGWVTEDDLAFDYRSLLPQMEPGDISQVQRIGNSAFLLKLINVREASYDEKVRSHIRRIIRETKLRRERSKWVDNLRADATIKFQKTF